MNPNRVPWRPYFKGALWTNKWFNREIYTNRAYFNDKGRSDFDGFSNNSAVLLSILCHGFGQRFIFNIQIYQVFLLREKNLRILFRKFHISFHFNLRLPIDIQTPIGYVVYMAQQTGAIIINTHSVVCVLGLLFGFFGFMMAFGQSIQRKIYDININCEKKSDKTKAQITKEFGDVIRFHSDVKEFSIWFTKSNHPKQFDFTIFFHLFLGLKWILINWLNLL